MPTPPPRRPLIAGNWKMNGLRAEGLARATNLAGRARTASATRPLAVDIALFPPATLVHALTEALSGAPILVGGQDCHWEASGAHTGDTSAAMLADAGARAVIVGHSERRRDHSESDATVRAKAAAAHGAGLMAIICVGESEEERDAGRTLEVLTGQLAGSLPPDVGAHAAHTVVAYEPVWAIGTGRVATRDQIDEVHRHLRAELVRRAGPAAAATIRLLYGGSVKPGNAGGILALDDVDGALVGGASLAPESFWGIIEAVPR